MARKARGSLKDEAKAEDKSKAKVEDTEDLTGGTRTRTRTRTNTRPGETTIPYQGGTLSPLRAESTSISHMHG